MVSVVLTLMTVAMVVLNVGAGRADSSDKVPIQMDLQWQTQCKLAELADEGMSGEKPITVATVKVYCGLRIFCPAEHRCCNVTDTVWCCPLPATCDPDMDADDWTGCHGAQGVNPL